MGTTIRTPHIWADQQNKLRRKLNLADKNCRDAHGAKLEHLVAISSVNEVVIYMLPMRGIYAVVWPFKASELTWTNTLRAAEQVIQAHAKVTAIPGHDLQVMFRTDEAFKRGENGVRAKQSKNGWLEGTLIEIDHPGLASLSQHHYQTWARVKVGTEIYEVSLGNLRMVYKKWNSHALNKKREQAEKLKLEIAELTNVNPQIGEIRTAKAQPKDPPEPLTEKLFKRLATQQKRRAAKGPRTNLEPK